MTIKSKTDGQSKLDAPWQREYLHDFQLTILNNSPDIHISPILSLIDGQTFQNINQLCYYY